MGCKFEQLEPVNPEWTQFFNNVEYNIW